MSKLEVQDLSLTIWENGSQTEVLNNLNLSVEDGEFVCIVGPSGCGKTTLLNLMSGLGKPSSGKIILNGTEVSGPTPRIGLVFQQYALFPWRTVAENIEFGLELRGDGEREGDDVAVRMINFLGLDGFENAYPYQLSGGMKQRVAIARALAMEPEVLLMDEPFAALDAQTRRLMQAELLRIQQKTKKTIVYVTHNVQEAVYFADRVIVLSDRPSQIVADVHIGAKKPRSQYTQAFKHNVERITGFLRAEHVGRAASSSIHIKHSRLRSHLELLGVLAFISLLLFSYFTYIPPMVKVETVRVGYHKNLAQGEVFVAKELGLYKKYGLDVEFNEFRVGPETMQAFLAGKLDLAYIGPIPPLIGVANNNARLKIVAGASKGGMSIVTLNKGIHSVSDLYGKTVCTPQKGNTQDVIFTGLILPKFGMGERDLNILYTPSSQMPALLETGSADACVAYEPYVSLLVLNYNASIIYDWNDTFGGDYPTAVLVASDAFIRDHPEELRSFLRAHVEAADILNRDPEYANKLLLKYYELSDVNTLLARKYGLPIEVVDMARTRLVYSSAVDTDVLADYDNIAYASGYTDRHVGKFELVDTSQLSELAGAHP